MKHPAFFVSFVLVLLPEHSAGIVLLPKDMTTYIGGTEKFVCSNLSQGSVHWSFISITSSNPIIIYTDMFGIAKELDDKYQVELNTTAGTCSLAISNISRNDAGAYSCETDKSTESANLVVIESPPECKPSVDFSRVLVNNDCNIEPDLIDITCSLKFYGDISPVLEWRQSNDPHVIRSNVSYSASRVQATSRLTIQPNFRMNGAHFSCSVKHANADETQFRCMTPNISVMYFFNSTEILDISPEEAVNMSCVANTSEHCNSKWQSTDPPMEFPSQKLPKDILNLDLKNIRCVAACTIRQKSCNAIPFVLNLTRPTFDLKKNTLQTVSFDKDAVPIPAVVIPILVVLIVAGVYTYVLIRKKRKEYKRSPEVRLETELTPLKKLLNGNENPGNNSKKHSMDSDWEVQLLSGLSCIPKLGTPGRVVVFGSSAKSILTGDNENDVVMAAAQFGEGRIVVISADGYVVDHTRKRFRGADEITKLQENVNYWVSRGTYDGDKCILNANHATKKDELNSYKIIIWKGRSGEIPTEDVEEFIKNGGGFIHAMCPWGWVSLNPGKMLEDMPYWDVLLSAGLKYTGDCLLGNEMGFSIKKNVNVNGNGSGDEQGSGWTPPPQPGSTTSIAEMGDNED